jgi:hypothetical protein
MDDATKGPHVATASETDTAMDEQVPRTTAVLPDDAVALVALARTLKAESTRHVHVSAS